jgi:hypothetical protein
VTKGEFAKGEIALASQAALAQSHKIFVGVVFRAIDDAEIFVAADL